MNIEILVSDRLGGKKFFKNPHIYRFTKLLELKESVKNLEGVKLLDFGIGEPGMRADNHVIETLYQEALKKENRFYSDNGIEEFKNSAKEYLKREYGVECASKTEILPIMGIKSALAYLPLCFIQKGDTVICCQPGYVVLENSAKWLGGEIFHLQLNKSNAFRPDFSTVPEEIWKKAKIIYLNYPNNPTGQVATKEMFNEIIELAIKYNFIVVNDAAYLPLTFKNKNKLSFLSLPNAKSVGIEVHSLSKGYNMTGWRLGFACGNEKIIKLLATVKDNIDSGQFIPIQKGGIKALESNIAEEMTVIYQKRIRKFGKFLKEIGFNFILPKAGYYLYLPCPKKVNETVISSAEEFSLWLLNKKHIFVIPYDDSGPYIRLSLSFEINDIDDEEHIFQEFCSRLRGERYLF